MADGDPVQPDTTLQPPPANPQADQLAANQGMLLPSLTQQGQQPLKAPNLRDMAMPNIARFISQMISPTPTPPPQGGQIAAPMRPASRLDAFEEFLGTFMTSFAHGLQESGHGPGANLRGAGAAMLAPQQQAMQQFGLNQQAQQAQQQQQQAQAQLEQTRQRTAQESQMVEVQDPGGNTIRVPASMAAKMFPAQFAAQARTEAAQTGAAAGIQKALIGERKGVTVANINANKPQTPGKVDPIIAAQLGMPPDAKGYAGGANDPKFKQDSQTWGTRAEAIKTRMAMQAASARGEAYGSWRPVQEIDPTTGETKWAFAKTAIAQGAAGASAGASAMGKQAQFKEIQSASTKFRSAIQNLDVDFTPAQRAKLTLAMRAPNESVLSNEISGILGTEQLTPKQQDYVIWSKQMQERALSIRSIAGMGQGSESLREAITATVPSVTSANKAYAIKQLDALDNQVASLFTGVPKVKGQGAPAAGGAAPTVQDLLNKYPVKK